MSDEDEVTVADALAGLSMAEMRSADTEERQCKTDGCVLPAEHGTETCFDCASVRSW